MDVRTSRYYEVYARWRRDPHGFWAEAARDIDWIEPPKQVFDPDAGVYGRWFTGGVCNTCWNAVDRHVLKGRGEQAAIIYDSPLAGRKRLSSPAATTTGPSCATKRSCSHVRCTIACRSRPQIRSTSSTRRARPAGPRASCATTAATWWR